MNKNNNDLTPKQERALAALLTEPTATAAAEKAGVALSTLMRWQHEPAFIETYKAARGLVLEGTLNALQSACAEAVATLRAVQNDITARAGEKVSAAKAVLEYSLKLRDAADVEERLAAVEAITKKLEEKK